MARKFEPKQITTIRLSPNCIRRLDRIAEVREVTRSSLIHQMIADGLQREERRRVEAPPEPATGGALD